MMKPSNSYERLWESMVHELSRGIREDDTMQQAFMTWEDIVQEALPSSDPSSLNDLRELYGDAPKGFEEEVDIYGSFFGVQLVAYSEHEKKMLAEREGVDLRKDPDAEQLFETMVYQSEAYKARHYRTFLEAYLTDKCFIKALKESRKRYIRVHLSLRQNRLIVRSQHIVDDHIVGVHGATISSLEL